MSTALWPIMKIVLEDPSWRQLRQECLVFCVVFRDEYGSSHGKHPMGLENVPADGKTWWGQTCNEEDIVSDTKAHFWKRPSTDLEKMTHFWDQFNVTYRTAYAMSFDHEVTFWRPVTPTCQHKYSGPACSLAAPVWRISDEIHRDCLKLSLSQHRKPLTSELQWCKIMNWARPSLFLLIFSTKCTTTEWGVSFLGVLRLGNGHKSVLSNFTMRTVV